MFDKSILSLARFIESNDHGTKAEFEKWLNELQEERLRALDGYFFTEEGSRIEAVFTRRAVEKRIEVFGAEPTTSSPAILSAGNFIFRLAESFRECIIEAETGGFFDEYETPSPAYWVDHRIIHSTPELKYPETVLISWLPKDLCDRFREVPRLSTTGAIVWSGDEGFSEYFPQLVPIDRECSDRLRQLLSGL